MKNQEAIEQLKFDQEMILFEPNNGNTLTLEEVKLHNEDNYKTYLADDMAIKALEKQIPKEPRFYNGNYYCPTCGALVGYHDIIIKWDNKFCKHCGQAIKWK